MKRSLVLAATAGIVILPDFSVLVPASRLGHPQLGRVRPPVVGATGNGSGAPSPGASRVRCRARASATARPVFRNSTLPRSASVSTACRRTRTPVLTADGHVFTDARSIQDVGPE